MPDRPSGLGAVILAGGRASRLGGADKPGLAIGSRTLVAAVAAAAAGAGARHLVLVGPPRPELNDLLASVPSAAAHEPTPGEPLAAGVLRPVTVDVTCEQPPGAGPVPALAAGLGLVREPWVLLLAADLPFLRPAHLREVARAAALASRGAVLLDDGGRPQWLTSCWPAEALRAALAGYGGRSLGGLLGPLSPVPVRLDASSHPPPWLDCDTPEELAEARRLASPRTQDPRSQDPRNQDLRTQVPRTQEGTR